MLRRLASSFDATLLWISKAGRLIVDVLVRCRPLLQSFHAIGWFWNYFYTFWLGHPELIHPNSFSCIPSLLTSIEANGYSCLLFTVSAWPPGIPLDCTVLPRIPSILNDLEANGCFCLLFVVSAWPPGATPDCTIWSAFLQFWTILKPMGTFADFSQFQPDRPEPLQTARFYQHSFKFERYWSQWVRLLAFRSFSLTAQNPSRLHDLTSIPSISSDIEAKGCFCLLFVISAWPPRTRPDCTILPAFLQFLTILKPLGAFAYFSWFHPGRPEPLPDCTILRAFLQFWLILKPTGTSAYFSRFQRGRPEPVQTARFYQLSFNFER